MNEMILSSLLHLPIEEVNVGPDYALCWSY